MHEYANIRHFDLRGRNFAAGISEQAVFFSSKDCAKTELRSERREINAIIPFIPLRNFLRTAFEESVV